MRLFDSALCSTSFSLCIRFRVDGLLQWSESCWLKHRVDLRYDTKLQNTWIEILRREGVRSLAMMEEIYGCPHEEGIDYPVGQVCPECPFWAHDGRPVEPPATGFLAIALRF